jgi:hypothetical protein
VTRSFDFCCCIWNSSRPCSVTLAYGLCLRIKQRSLRLEIPLVVRVTIGELFLVICMLLLLFLEL